MYCATVGLVGLQYVITYLRFLPVIVRPRINLPDQRHPGAVHETIRHFYVHSRTGGFRDKLLRVQAAILRACKSDVVEPYIIPNQLILNVRRSICPCPTTDAVLHDAIRVLQQMLFFTMPSLKVSVLCVDARFGANGVLLRPTNTPKQNNCTDLHVLSRCMQCWHPQGLIFDWSALQYRQHGCRNTCTFSAIR